MISLFGPPDSADCPNLWHTTLSIRDERCPQCEGAAKRESDSPLSLGAEELLDFILDLPIDID
jgi:hypothetical protein